MVGEIIVQHPTYTKLTRFLESATAREKLLRVLQYFVRFLKIFYAGNENVFQLLKNLQETFTMARKPLRFMKPLNHLQSLSSCLSNELQDSQLKFFEAIKQFGFSVYFTLDSIQWLKKLQLLNSIKFKNYKIVRNIDSLCSAFWCIALIGGLLKNLRQLEVYILKSIRLDKDVEKSESTKKLEIIKIHKINRDFIKNILDFIIALNAYKSLKINDGIIGACGTITSLMALEDIWSTK